MLRGRHWHMVFEVAVPTMLDRIDEVDKGRFAAEGARWTRAPSPWEVRRLPAFVSRS